MPQGPARAGRLIDGPPPNCVRGRDRRDPSLLGSRQAQRAMTWLLAHEDALRRPTPEGRRVRAARTATILGDRASRHE